MSLSSFRVRSGTGTVVLSPRGFLGRRSGQRFAPCLPPPALVRKASRGRQIVSISLDLGSGPSEDPHRSVQENSSRHHVKFVDGNRRCTRSASRQAGRTCCMYDGRARGEQTRRACNVLPGAFRQERSSPSRTCHAIKRWIRGACPSACVNASVQANVNTRRTKYRRVHRSRARDDATPTELARPIHVPSTTVRCLRGTLHRREFASSPLASPPRTCACASRRLRSSRAFVSFARPSRTLPPPCPTLVTFVDMDRDRPTDTADNRAFACRVS